MAGDLDEEAGDDVGSQLRELFRQLVLQSLHAMQASHQLHHGESGRVSYAGNHPSR